MSSVWNKVYSKDRSFFGKDPSNFAMLCFNHMKINRVRKVLELGAGHGRDSIFFASNGIDVTALDYSSVGVDVINELARQRKLNIQARVFDVREPLSFPDGTFDAVYSHMLLNMRFTMEELQFIFSEISRVLRPRGFNFFSVRNRNDGAFAKGKMVEDGVYDINGFEVRFYSEQEIESLTRGFEILWVREEYEEPVTLYLLSTRKL